MAEVIKANIGDIKELQRICRQSYTKVFANHWTDDGLDLYLKEQFNNNRLINELNNSTYNYFFIRKNKENIGFAKINYKTAEELSDLDNCELEKIYIFPNYNGLGIGKSVMENLIMKAKNLGKKLMYLCVIDTNLSAIAFYKKIGFQYHSKTRLDAPLFKEELRGMNRMYLNLDN